MIIRFVQQIVARFVFICECFSSTYKKYILFWQWRENMGSVTKVVFVSDGHFDTLSLNKKRPSSGAHQVKWLSEQQPHEISKYEKRSSETFCYFEILSQIVFVSDGRDRNRGFEIFHCFANFISKIHFTVETAIFSCLHTFK